MAQEKGNSPKVKEQYSTFTTIVETSVRSKRGSIMLPKGTVVKGKLTHNGTKIFIPFKGYSDAVCFEEKQLQLFTKINHLGVRR